MKTRRIRIYFQNPATLPVGRVDYQVLDGATEAQLEEQQKVDDAGCGSNLQKPALPVKPKVICKQLDR